MRSSIFFWGGGGVLSRGRRILRPFFWGGGCFTLTLVGTSLLLARKEKLFISALCKIYIFFFLLPFETFFSLLNCRPEELFFFFLFLSFLVSSYTVHRCPPKRPILSPKLLLREVLGAPKVYRTTQFLVKKFAALKTLQSTARNRLFGNSN